MSKDGQCRRLHTQFDTVPVIHMGSAFLCHSGPESYPGPRVARKARRRVLPLARELGRGHASACSFAALASRAVGPSAPWRTVPRRWVAFGRVIAGHTAQRVKTGARGRELKLRPGTRFSTGRQARDARFARPAGPGTWARRHVYRCLYSIGIILNKKERETNCILFIVAANHKLPSYFPVPRRRRKKPQKKSRVKYGV